MAVEEFLTELENWTGKCQWCFLGGKISRHDIRDCKADGVEVAQQEFQAVRDGINYAKYSACFQCGVPQSICKTFVSNGKSGWVPRLDRTTCQFPNTILATYSAIMVGGPVDVQGNILRWMGDSGIDVKHPHEVHRWLGEKVRLGSIEAAMITKVFLRLVQAIH